MPQWSVVYTRALVAQWFKASVVNTEDRGFYSRQGHFNFSQTLYLKFYYKSFILKINRRKNDVHICGFLDNFSLREKSGHIVTVL